MRTLQLLIEDWRNQAVLLNARGTNRFTATRHALVSTCLFAMAWAFLAVIHANRELTSFFELAVGIALVTLASLFLASASQNWRLARTRTVSGLGWTILVLMGIEFVCVGLALRQWPWVLAGALIGGSSINLAIHKFEASWTRAGWLRTQL